MPPSAPKPGPGAPPTRSSTTAAPTPTTVQLTNTTLQQTWQLTAAADANGQPAHFVVLQSRPASQSLTVLDNR